MKTIIVEVSGGLVTVVRDVPPGVLVMVRDYDVEKSDSHIQFDADGNPCRLSFYGGA